jgi:hypothetical protein
MTRTDLEQAVARAIANQSVAPGPSNPFPRDYLREARAALSAIEGAGYVVVPKDAHAGPVGNEVW